MVSRTRKKRIERGVGELLDFAVAFPIFLMLIAAIVVGCWMYWAQTIQNVATVRALRLASQAQGGQTVNAGAGAEFYSWSTMVLGGGKTSGLLGSPTIELSGNHRSVEFTVSGGTTIQFAGITINPTFHSGGTGRLSQFWPGPPDPWE